MLRRRQNICSVASTLLSKTEPNTEGHSDRSDIPAHATISSRGRPLRIYEYGIPPVKILVIFRHRHTGLLSAPLVLGEPIGHKEEDDSTLDVWPEGRNGPSGRLSKKWRSVCIIMNEHPLVYLKGYRFSSLRGKGFPRFTAECWHVVPCLFRFVLYTTLD